jgi:HAD superfamily hydrolase (TIGR01549 family)
VKATLLFDLDDTLLVNNIDTFLPAYLRILSQVLSPYNDPERIVKQLLVATREMIKNQRPDCTLKQVFENNFYPALGLKIEELKPVLDRFYNEAFPTLKSLTSPRPEAVGVVKEALQRGYKIAIATNPLFPRTAILQRLSWAGLDPEEYPFDLIASFEGFHFAKPNPAYFAEIMGYLGWPDGPVIMVGDNLENDIKPARRMGWPAFWITKSGSAPLVGEETPSMTGNLDQVFSWLDKQDPETMEPEYNQPAAMLPSLRATPAVLQTVCFGLTTQEWNNRPVPEEWCPTEILCHMRDVDREVNLARIKKVLTETNPFISGKDTDPWANERKYICQNGPEALQKFITARLELLSLLQDLPPESWQRRARHAILGPTSLAELVSIIAAHDRLHIQQMNQDLLQLSP